MMGGPVAGGRIGALPLQSKRESGTVDSARKEPTATDSKRFSPWRLWPLVLVALGFAAFFAFGLNEYLSFDALANHREDLFAWREQHHALAAVVFILAYATMVALSVPGAVWMTIGGGFLFGTIVATALVMVGATAGAILIFLIARYALADYLRGKAGGAVRRMEQGFRDNAFSYLLVLRLVPLFPFWLVNLVPAFLGVPLATFAIGTFIGIAPGTFVYSGVGNGLGAVIAAGGSPDLGIIFAPQVLLPILGLVLLSLLPIAYKRYRVRRAGDSGTPRNDAPSAP